MRSVDNSSSSKSKVKKKEKTNIGEVEGVDNTRTLAKTHKESKRRRQEHMIAGEGPGEEGDVKRRGKKRRMNSEHTTQSEVQEISDIPTKRKRSEKQGFPDPRE